MDQMRVGVIGYGYWGPNLVRNFHKAAGCQVAAVADLDPGRLAALKRAFPHLETTTEFEGLLSRSDIDAVAVATPISTHYALAKRALENGKHVLVEKPMTESTAQALELIELARRNHRVLMVDHTFIYTGAVRKIRELVDRGELGAVFYLDSVRINLGLFQHDVNVLWDLAPHDFSIMSYLLDKEPKAVSAIGACPIAYSDRQLESIAYVTVSFGNDVLAHFHLSWVSPLKIRRMIIGGDKKMVVYDHLDPDNQVKVFDKGAEVRTADETQRVLVQRRMGDMYAPKVDQTEALELVCEHFVECARTGARPITDGAAGLKAVRLLEAAHVSMRRQGEVVSL